MFFLLVTLLANYGDTSCHSHAYRLQSAIKQELDSQAFLAITRYGCPVCRHRSVLWARAVPVLARVHLNPALGAAQPLGGVGKRLSRSLVIRTGVGAVGHGERTQDRPSTALPAPMSGSPGRASSPGQHWLPPAGPAGPLTLGGWAVRDGHVTDSGFGVGRSDEFWPWMSHVLLPYIHGNQSRPELGPPRLRQVRLQEGESLRGALALSLTCFQREACAGVWIQCPRRGDGLPGSPDVQTVTPTSWAAGRAR